MAVLEIAIAFSKLALVLFTTLACEVFAAVGQSFRWLLAYPASKTQSLLGRAMERVGHGRGRLRAWQRRSGPSEACPPRRQPHRRATTSTSPPSSAVEASGFVIAVSPAGGGDGGDGSSGGGRGSNEDPGLALHSPAWAAAGGRLTALLRRALVYVEAAAHGFLLGWGATVLKELFFLPPHRVDGWDDDNRRLDACQDADYRHADYYGHAEESGGGGRRGGGMDGIVGRGAWGSAAATARAAAFEDGVAVGLAVAALAVGALRFLPTSHAHRGGAHQGPAAWVPPRRFETGKAAAAAAAATEWPSALTC